MHIWEVCNLVIFKKEYGNYTKYHHADLTIKCLGKRLDGESDNAVVNHCSVMLCLLLLLFTACLKFLHQHVFENHIFRCASFIHIAIPGSFLSLPFSCFLMTILEMTLWLSTPLPCLPTATWLMHIHFLKLIYQKHLAFLSSSSLFSRSLQRLIFPQMGRGQEAWWGGWDSQRPVTYRFGLHALFPSRKDVRVLLKSACQLWGP